MKTIYVLMHGWKQDGVWASRPIEAYEDFSNINNRVKEEEVWVKDNESEKWWTETLEIKDGEFKCNICNQNGGNPIFPNWDICDSCKTKYQPEIDKLLEKAPKLEEMEKCLVALSQDETTNTQLDKLLEEALNLDILDLGYLLRCVYHKMDRPKILNKKLHDRRFSNKIRPILPTRNGGDSSWLGYVIKRTYDIRYELKYGRNVRGISKRYVNA